MLGWGENVELINNIGGKDAKKNRPRQENSGQNLDRGLHKRQPQQDEDDNRALPGCFYTGVCMANNIKSWSKNWVKRFYI